MSNYLILNLTKNHDFFTIWKVKAIFLLAKQILKIYFYKDKDSLYINNVKLINLTNIIEYVIIDKK